MEVLVAIAVGIVAYFGGARTGGSSESGTAFYTDKTRRQVIGDAAIIEKGIRNGWSDIFKLEGERFLASFAILGVKAGQRNTSEKEFAIALEAKCEINPTDSREKRNDELRNLGIKTVGLEQD